MSIARSATHIHVSACNHDINWLQKLSPDVTITISGCLSECHDESYGYLDFIVKHYDDLASHIIFVHGHETASHYDEPVQTAINRLLTTTYMRSVPFGGLFCRTNTVFAASAWMAYHKDIPDRAPTELWEMAFSNTGVRMPPRWFYPCCGTFFVSRDAVRRHSKRTYEQLLSNLKQKVPEALRHGVCGRILESGWASLFLPPRTNYTPPPHCTANGGCPGGVCERERQHDRRATFHAFYLIGGGVGALYGLAFVAHRQRREACVRGCSACWRIACTE